MLLLAVRVLPANRRGSEHAPDIEWVLGAPLHRWQHGKVKKGEGKGDLRCGKRNRFGRT
ncbi:uncharacterized protein BDZ83DRAFT_636573 [Colletotrichum acutatum]|uniref:Uncharacterized protein n=1 Tax=Glomerella acutata TaxID=27357 RepID=A0AAD8UDU1_GLOAC|nr:uncharacterized protein BDZ83DRAFT_636573 [Colletotrichum acutatum]KAK1714523.1 hypothetical protein BDZ83DRAFT_636573 [Colletotrichum acutatum]